MKDESNIKIDTDTMQHLQQLKTQLNLKSIKAVITYLVDAFTGKEVVAQHSEITELRDEFKALSAAVMLRLDEHESACQAMVVKFEPVELRAESAELRSVQPYRGGCCPDRLFCNCGDKNSPLA